MAKAKTKSKRRRSKLPPDFDKDRYCTSRSVMLDVRAFWPAGIGLDVCGDPDSIVDAISHFDIRLEQDALVLDWGWELEQTAQIRAPLGCGRTVWVQPPHSDPGPFIERAVHAIQTRRADETLTLIPGTAATKWWANYVTCHARAVCLWGPGRMNYLRNGVLDHGARGETALVLHCRQEEAAEACDRFRRVFGTRGMVVTRPRPSAWEWHSELPLEQYVSKPP